MKKIIKKSTKKRKNKSKLSVVYLGAGCFWGVEEAFRTIAGVVATEVGYAGGFVKDATYEQVCSNETGHAEVVKVTYDESLTRFKKIIDLFWRIHDPTQMNRQGPDVGTQYRSVIFYTNTKQKKEAEESLREEQKKRSRTIATAIEKAGIYCKAEEYHQKYVIRNDKPVC
jgi:peptide-methionine (S)-S-oxide reductase